MTLEAPYPSSSPDIYTPPTIDELLQQGKNTRDQLELTGDEPPSEESFFRQMFQTMPGCVQFIGRATAALQRHPNVAEEVESTLRQQMNVLAEYLIQACEYTAPLSSLFAEDDEDLEEENEAHQLLYNDAVRANYGPFVCSMYTNPYISRELKVRMSPVIALIAEELVADITAVRTPRPTLESITARFTGPYGLHMTEEELARVLEQEQERWDEGYTSNLDYEMQFYPHTGLLQSYMPSYPDFTETMEDIRHRYEASRAE